MTTIQHDSTPQQRRRGSDYHRFQWFHWLHMAAPDCEIAKAALDAVWEKNPDFKPREYPDLNIWFSGTKGYRVTSQWTVEALLQMPADTAVQELLAYSPNERQLADGEHREAMLQNVNAAAKTDHPWGLDLADSLVQSRAWESDLWLYLFMAWGETELDLNGKQRLLSHLSSSELHRRHPREVASVLSKLAQSAKDPEAIEWLDAANQIAIALRPYAAGEALPDIVSSVGGVPQYVSWLQKAINHASGQLALFWVHSARLWKRQNLNSQSLNSEYRSALDTIIMEDGVSGQFGRTVLASQLNFFLAVDEIWAIDNLLPLFDVAHDDFQCAWDGVLTWGSLSPSTAERIRESAINAVPRIVQEFDHHMLARFVGFYVTAMGWLIQHANDEWITRFFTQADATAKEQFALQVGRSLRSLDENAQAEWWNVWLKDYWHNRLQGVPGPLDNEENAQMLGWVVNLPGVFPEAVGMATKMPKAAISRSLILRRIGESELIERHPTELARFLVHLGQCDTDPLFWMGTRNVFDSLLEMDLPTEIATGLREIAVTRHLG